MIRFYVRNDDGTVYQVPDLLTWSLWHAHHSVGFDCIGEVNVSTVFLGIDRNQSGGPPILWETIVFGGEHDGYQQRYTSETDALEGHKKACAMVRK